jgi:hypothetical protein
MMRIEKGASYRPTSKRDIFFAISGQGMVDGEPLRRFTTVFLDFGERASFKAEEETALVRIRMPDLRHLMAAQSAKVAAE